MSEPGIVLVVRDATYGSASMRGLQMAESLAEIGVPARVLRAGRDRSSLLELRDATVVLVKDAVVEDELILALEGRGNRLAWDVVDFPAHKPPLAGVETPADHLRQHAASVCIRQLLVMTKSAGEVLAPAFSGLDSVEIVDHQVDRSLLDLSPEGTATAFSIGYLGASENLPRWVPERADFRVLLTSERPFAELVPEARSIPVHVDFRDPTRDRRDLKPWTKSATAIWLGAVVIAEAGEANVGALGSDYPLLFDGTRLGFVAATDRARRLWADGEWAALHDSLQPLRERSHPLRVAERLAAAVRAP